MMNFKAVLSLALVFIASAKKIPLFQPRYDYHKLFGSGIDRPEELPDGSVNCIIEGVDVGFHCLMRPRKGITPEGSALYQNRNADLCYDKVTPRKLRTGDKDDVHCHGSYESDLYRYVILDHLNRGYEGTLDCMCGYGPVGFVSDCDVTTRTDQGRYDSGDDECLSGKSARDRKGQYRWGQKRWGVSYLEETGDEELYEELLAQSGLDDRRRSACLQTSVTPDEKDPECGLVETTYNSCLGIKTIMTFKNPDVEGCLDMSSDEKKHVLSAPVHAGDDDDLDD